MTGGSTYLVMGRSITGAANPAAVVDSIIGELSSLN
jgi:orotidine-5'-phosphate decarboxylase